MEIQIQQVILIFMRITAFIVLCPGISFKGIPNIFKIGIALSLTILVYSTVPEIVVVDNLLLFAILVIKEALFGLSIGFVTKLVFSTMEMAGQFIDFQVGFSMASVFDPSIGINASNYGRVYYWMSLCAFFLLDMHHRLIATLIQSFEYVPLTSVNIDGLTVGAVLNIFSRVFELAFNLAAPMIIVLLLTDVVLGVISRAVPQINVLMLGMPLKAMVSFLVSMVGLSWLLNSIGNIIQLMPDYIEGFINLM